MRRGIRISLGALAAAGVTAATGCGSTSSTAGPPVATTRGVAASEPAADPGPYAAADTAFGLDVLRAWCAQYPGRNLVFSPSTLASSLGLAYAGAHGATAAAMARVLHLPASGGPALAAGLQARSTALSGLGGPGVTLAASNQVWADPTLPPRRSYLNAVATGYDAGLAQAPFLSSPDKAAAEVNQSISALTRGHITNLVSPGEISDVGWLLTSALYLDARWATPFDPNKDDPASFTLANKQHVQATYLESFGLGYAKHDGWTAVDLPYQGGKLTMTALLPPAGSGSCALPSQSSLAALGASLRAGQTRGAEISLPKVSLSIGGTTGSMKPVLQRLGLGVAFDSSTADFTGLSKAAGPLAFVQQAATLDVAEKGTVAAAASATGVEPAMGVVSKIAVSFDRPYVMLVSAKATGEPLFLAEVANPAQS